MDLRKYSNYKERNKAVEKQTGTTLTTVDKVFQEDPKNVHCENLIGAVTIPLGVAGPAKLSGSTINGTYYIPLATSEGALVASVNRGCKAITESGGAHVHIDNVGVTRGSIFETKSLKDTVNFKRWLTDNQKVLAEQAAETSSHLRLLNIEASILNKTMYVRFSYNTSDAMGMNMVTIATDKICHYIEKIYDVKCIAVAGNFDIDKKPAWLNSISGRGRKAWAEVIIPSDSIKKVLKTDAQQLYQTVIKKCWGGSMMSGSLGFNAHFANITAAFFAATGQDLAHVVEGSLGITSADVLENGDLYFSVYMPDIMIGTVGGGTKLKTQTEARSIIGVDSADELAEVFVGAVLAGELSLLASISQNTLARAHQKLGR